MERYVKDGVFYNGRSIIVYTEHGPQTIFNPDVETLVANGYEVYVKPELTEEQRLVQAKQNLINSIEDYDNSANVNSFSISGKDMWLDHDTRQQLKISIDAYAATGAETVTKWFDGVEYTFPTSTWLGMLAQLEVYAGESKNVTDAHLAAVESLETVEDVEAFDYTAGYPQKLEF